MICFLTLEPFLVIACPLNVYRIVPKNMHEITYWWHKLHIVIFSKEIASISKHMKNLSICSKGNSIYFKVCKKTLSKCFLKSWPTFHQLETWKVLSKYCLIQRVILAWKFSQDQFIISESLQCFITKICSESKT